MPRTTHVVQVLDDPPQAGEQVRCLVDGWQLAGRVLHWDPWDTEVTILVGGHQVTLTYQSSGDAEGQWVGQIN